MKRKIDKASSKTHPQESPLHPDNALFDQFSRIPNINSCDHYAGNPSLLTKSLKLQQKLEGRFDITCDLEDGASIGDEKKLHSDLVEIINSELNCYSKVGLRIHDLSSKLWSHDLKVFLKKSGSLISHITVPKVLDSQQLKPFIKCLSSLEKEYKLKRKIPVHILIETHTALRDSFNIAALPGVRGLEFGLMDFVSAHNGLIPSDCMQSPGQFEHQLLVRAKGEVVAAASANHRVAAHNVTVNYRDIAQTFQDAMQAHKRFGFTRMWSIHPSQISPIIDAMRPDTKEINSGAEIILAGMKAMWAPISHSGRLHDRASYRYYWQLLKRAHCSGNTVPSEIGHLFT